MRFLGRSPTLENEIISLFLRHNSFVQVLLQFYQIDVQLLALLHIRMRKLGLPATQPGVVGVPSTPPIAKLDQLDLAACTYCKNLWCDSRCCTLKCQTF